MSDVKFKGITAEGGKSVTIFKGVTAEGENVPLANFKGITAEGQSSGGFAQIIMLIN